VFKTTGTGKHKKTHEVCTVSVLSPGSHMVSVDISRGKRMYAVGVGLVSNGKARFTLRTLRAMRHGRYVVTVVSTSGHHATVRRFVERF
jgi:hypothetical protein